LSQCSSAALFPHELSDAELCLTFFFHGVLVCV
jgi:hypothetical protein